MEDEYDSVNWFAERDASKASAFILHFPSLADRCMVDNGMEGYYFTLLHKSAIRASLLQDRPDLVPVTHGYFQHK